MKLRCIKFMVPGPLSAHTFYHGVKRYIVDVWQGFEYTSCSEYAKVLNTPVF